MIIKKNESNSILLDALGGLFSGKISMNSTLTSKELNFDKYTNFSLSYGTITPYSNTKESVISTDDTEDILSKIPKEELTECKEIGLTKKDINIDFYIFLKSLSGKLFLIKTNPNETIKTIKAKYYYISKIPISQQRIIYNGKEFENSKTLSDYKIDNKTTLHIVLKQLLTLYSKKPEKQEEYHIPNNLFDPQYDYDFTYINDTNKKFMRGGLEYKRPCGWKRFALKVSGKYENDNWLTDKGTCINDSEWAVSYHGTKVEKGSSIIEYGLKLSEKYNFSIGIYCTSDIEVCKEFSPVIISPFTKKKYQVIFQNRVRPSSIRRASEIGGPDYFWYVSDDKDIRPYCICIKEVS